VAAMQDAKPDLAIGTTPLVQKGKELGIPSLYFTNMVSARPLFGPAGAGSMSGIVAAQTRGKARFASMVDFFDGVGTGGKNAGHVWPAQTPSAAKAAAKPVAKPAAEG